MPGLGQAIMVDAFAATSVIVDDAWAVFKDGSTLSVETYYQGLRLGEVRGTVELPQEGTPADFTIISSDGPQFVANGAILWRNLSPDGDCNAVNSWDIGAAIPAIYSSAAPAGTAFSAPMYETDYIYWLEHNLAQTDGNFVVRLNKARANLSSPTVEWEASWVMPDESGFASSQILLPRISATCIRFVVMVLHGETGAEYVEVGVPLAGGTVDFPTLPAPGEWSSNLGLRCPGGCAFASLSFPEGSGAVDLAPYLFFEADSTTAAPSSTWPDPSSDSDWLTGWTRIFSFNLTPNRTKAWLYGKNPAEPSASVVIANTLDDGFHVKHSVEQNEAIGFPIAYFPSR